jgi:hypothetical protein
MKMRIVASAFLCANLLLSACTGDSRPFSEAVEVRTLNLQSIEVVQPLNSLPEIFLNINQGLQLSLRGIAGSGNSIPLAANNRQWAVSDPSIASITENGYLRALANGTVDVTVSIGGINSIGFGLTVFQADLTEINAISGATTLERCLPQDYAATGTFSDGTNRTLDDITWTVSNPANAHLIETTGSTTKVNALAAMDLLTLTATSASGQSLDQAIIVSDSLQTIEIRPRPIVLDVDQELNVTGIGIYSDSTGDEVIGTREANITNNLNWVVVTGTSNLSVSNVSGTKGLLTGLDDGEAEVTASCGVDNDRELVEINALGTSTTTSLAFKIGNTLVSGNQITLSRSANLGAIPLLASTGSEYDADNDVTDKVDFQRRDSTSSVTQPFEIDGNDTSTPTIRLTAIGTATIVATETTEGEAVEFITITVIN